MRSRILRLPAAGTLLVCGDLHGNRKDYERIKGIFQDEHEKTEATFILYLGDLIHGPSLEKENWPEHLGDYYIDESDEIIRDFMNLSDCFPGHIHMILGNHEHSHIGGPITSKFHPDERLHLECLLGKKDTYRMKRFLKALPLIAMTFSGLVFSHGAPSNDFSDLDDIETLSYSGFEDLSIHDMSNQGFLGKILWQRSASPLVVRDFLRKVSLPELPSSNRIAVYSHDIVWEGYERLGDEQFVFSSSFGLLDVNKTYLKLDLGVSYPSSHAFREGIEIQWLYPDVR
jgi:hypothetical protein